MGKQHEFLRPSVFRPLVFGSVGGVSIRLGSTLALHIYRPCELVGVVLVVCSTRREFPLFTGMHSSGGDEGRSSDISERQESSSCEGGPSGGDASNPAHNPEEDGVRSPAVAAAVTAATIARVGAQSSSGNPLPAAVPRALRNSRCIGSIGSSSERASACGSMMPRCDVCCRTTPAVWRTFPPVRGASLLAGTPATLGCAGGTRVRLESFNCGETLRFAGTRRPN